MNTPAHVLISGALFARPGNRKVTGAAFSGALLPDVSLYLMAGTALFLLDIPPNVVFGQLYFSPSWQTVFAIDNSFVIYGAIALVSWWRSSLTGLSFSGAALVHVLTDFLLHNDDARRHFYPVSDWVFHSPVSYWDSAHHANWAAPIGAVVATLAGVAVWRSFHDLRMRTVVLVMIAMELWVARQWILFF